MTSQSRNTHDRLVQLTVAEMQRQGATSIRADHLTNFSQPAQVGDYIPDVTGYFGNSFTIAEAESTDMLNSEHTTAQWRTFYNAACRMNGYFIAVVAPTDRNAAASLLRNICGNAQNVRLWTF